ncbi:DUF4230 domain-containing protein [Novosphingobium sp.]|uniref:DUF4230 domain-containing protein n=1 Tax=Novosphingobium sp. TaxID=1874826 RepID=UPI003D125525
MREVARLETLDISLHRKIEFAPVAEAQADDAVWQDVLRWAKQTLAPAHGKAIVFAVAHMGFDLAELNEDHVRVDRQTVYVVVPPLTVAVELLPGETEVIGSNLDSAETSALLENAKQAFLQQVKADPQLTQRARQSGERALRGLCAGLGFTQVVFVPQLPLLGGT